MANPDGPRRKKSPAEWAMLKARARAEPERLQQQMETLTDQPAQPGVSEELWNAVGECPDLFADAALLECEAESVYDRLVLDLGRLDRDLRVLEAELFLHYAREPAAVSGANVTEPTVEEIRAAIKANERHQALVQRREVLVNEAQEAQSVLEQLTVTRAAIEQHNQSLLRLFANRGAEMEARSAVSQSPSPADPDFPVAERTEDKSSQTDNVGRTNPSDRVTLEKSRRKRGSPERRRYLGADSPLQFRNYLRWLRRFLELEERLYELARLGAGSEVAELRQGLAKDITARFAELPPGTLFGDLLLVMARPLAYGDAEARVWKFVERFLPEKGSLADDPLAEHVAEFKRKLARSRVPRVVGWPGDDDRLAAAGRIVDLIGHAIYPARWPRVKKVLDEMASLHERGADDELRKSLIANLFEAVEVTGEYTLAEEDDVRRALRAHLNKLVTVDLLGPGWRHARHEVDPAGAQREIEERELEHSEPERPRVERAKPEQRETEQRGVEPKRAGPVSRNRIASKAARAKAGLEAEIVGRLESERLFAAAKLTVREAEVVSEVARLGGEHGAAQAAAEKLGIAPATARVLLSKARKKLAAARKTLTATNR